MLPGMFSQGQTPTLAFWQKVRREEILHLFQREVYGFTPTVPPTLTYRVLEREQVEDSVIKERIALTVALGGKQASFEILVYTPADKSRKLPAVIMLNPFSRNPALDHAQRDQQHMPYQDITAQGYAAVYALVDGLALDDKDRYQTGIFELFPRENAHSWGVISAWAWAGSRTVDFLCANDLFDRDRIAMAGFSRGGKAALWCAAQDERVSLVISASSGCTGAAVTRGKTGEHVADITTQFPHWFAERYKEYGDREDALPVDQHMLLGLIAPRKLYVSSSSEDSWADPESEFKSLVLAEEIYRLYGLEAVDPGVPFPEVDTQIIKGCSGYHRRKGAHACTREDWKLYLQFISRHFQ